MSRPPICAFGVLLLSRVPDVVADQDPYLVTVISKSWDVLLVLLWDLYAECQEFPSWYSELLDMDGLNPEFTEPVFDHLHICVRLDLSNVDAELFDPIYTFQSGVRSVGIDCACGLDSWVAS